jgi:lambda family phage tail tape measure protein
MSLGSLNIDLNANIIKFQAAMEKAAYLANQNMEKVAKAAGSAESAIKGLEGMLGKVGVAMGTLGIIGSVSGLISLAKDSIAGAAELKDLSEQTGASVEALSALKAVAKLAGMDLKDAGAGASKLSKAMADAQGGSEKQVATFKRLGVTYVDATGKLRPVGDVMLDVGRKFADTENGAGKTALAMDLMGKKGAAMIPMLQELAERGNVEGKVTTELAEKADHLEKTWMKMVGKLNSWKGSALETMIPMLERIIPMLPTMATGLIGFFGITKILPAAIMGVTSAITAMGAATSAAGLVGLGIFTKLRTAVIALNAAVLANPMVALATAILAAATAAYLFQDSLVTIGGATASVGNWIGGTWDLIKGGAMEAWSAIKDAFSKAGAWIEETWAKIRPSSEGFFSSVAELAKTGVNTVIGAYVGLGRAAGIVFDAMKEAWKNALTFMSGLGSDFAEGVAAALRGDVAFTAFRKRLSDTGAKASEVGDQIKTALKDAISTDYVGKAGAALGGTFDKIRQNALARQAAEDAARKHKNSLNTIQQPAGSLAGAAQQDPFAQAMMDLQRQAVGIQYVIDNFDRLGGKIRDSKGAMAEFDVQMGKFSDAERRAAKLSPLTDAQKAAYIERARLVENLEVKEKQLIGLKKFDDGFNKYKEETAGLKESAIQREINVKLADLETAGIKKGTEEYVKRQQVVAAGVQDRYKTQLNLSMSEYIEQQKRSIDNDGFMISMLGRSSLEVAKLTEAHRIDAEVQEMIRKAQRDGVTLTQEEIAAQYAKAEAVKQTRLAQIDLAAAIQRTPQFGASEAMRKYQEAANDTGYQVENALTNAFKGVEDAFVKFSETGKLSFKGLVASINADVARMGVKSMMSGAMDWLKGGAGGGIGGMLSGVMEKFGLQTPGINPNPGGAIAGAAGAATGAASSAAAGASVAALGTSAATSSAALATMTASTTALDAVSATLVASFGTLAVAAETAAAAMAASGASSGASGLGSLAGLAGSAAGDGGWAAMLGGAFAGGGDPPVGKMSLVGEEGPELFVPKTAGTILPNDFFKNAAANDSGTQKNLTVHITNTFAENTSKDTINQGAARQSMQVQRAMRSIG